MIFDDLNNGDDFYLPYKPHRYIKLPRVHVGGTAQNALRANTNILEYFGGAVEVWRHCRPEPCKPEWVRPHEQACGRCGAIDGMNFHVPDDMWKLVASPDWCNEHYDSVLCLACFDNLAEAKCLDYAKHVERVVFCGRQGSLSFDVRQALDRAEFCNP